MKRFVTSALPYANGSIHIGHLVETIQADIWVKARRLAGDEVYYVCADDTHGTPIMLNAQSLGISPEALIAKYHQEHLEDFKRFHIHFSYYGSTHTTENQKLAEEIYLNACEKGHIEKRQIQQLYCPHCQMFLPDRFIKGICPSCHAKDQYGDSCDHCGSTYEPVDLISSSCAHCGTPPVLKSSEHFFFKVSVFSQEIQSWLQTGVVLPEIFNKMQEWFSQGIKDWDISRDAPYFGFKIPHTKDLYFYVWLDAPIGYLSLTHYLAQETPVTYQEVWQSQSFKIHHFIGKDILYFHTLFWPALLKSASLTLPHHIHVHGFLTVNGQKMSKSKGTFITAKTFSEHVNPELLRYYYASKLSSGMDDLDLNIDDFVLKINSELLGKIVNIASRLTAIVIKKLGGHLTQMDTEGQVLFHDMLSKRQLISDLYHDLSYSKAIKEITRLADLANQYIDQKAPWSELDTQKASAVCTSGIHFFKVLFSYLKPVLPHTVMQAEKWLQTSFDWDDLQTVLEDVPLSAYTHLLSRLDAKLVKSSLNLQ